MIQKAKYIVQLLAYMPAVQRHTIKPWDQLQLFATVQVQLYIKQLQPKPLLIDRAWLIQFNIYIVMYSEFVS